MLSTGKLVKARIVPKIPESLGAKLKAGRESVGLSQSAAGKHVGVSQGSISNYEQDVGDVPLSQLRKLSALYGISLADMFSDEPLAQKPMAVIPTSVAEARLALLRLIIDADDGRIDIIAGVLSSMLPAANKHKPSSAG